MREYDRFILDFDVISILPREHVNLPLVETQLANVGTQKEYIRTLHGGLEHLRSLQVVTLLPAHDGGAPLHPTQTVLAGDVHHHRLLLLRVPVDQLRAPQEAHVRHVHPHCLPDFGELGAYKPDVVQVAAHFVVHQGE